MANVTIFPETTRSDFGLDDVFGYCTVITQNVTALEIGKVYTVVWDGSSYDCVGIDASEVLPNAVAIGNLAGFGGYGQGEPFAIAYMWQTLEDLYGEGYVVSALSDSSTTHTFAIYEKEQPEPDPEPEPEPEPDIVLKDYNGEDMFFSGVEKVALENTEGEMVFFSKGDTLENIDIELDFTNGNQTVEAPRGYLVKGATIQKPEELKPENIVKGKEIAGVAGAFEVSAETKTIDLDFSSGDMVVTPSEGKALSQVDIPKPETLVPENIAKDVTVAGIVGTHAGGGGSGNETLLSKSINFYDIFGNLRYSYTRAEAATLTELPPVPELEEYESGVWSHTLEQVKTAVGFLDIGPRYKRDGLSAYLLVVEVNANESVPIYFTQRKEGTVTAYWGDGKQSSNTISNTSVTTWTKTYSKAGIYVIGFTSSYPLYFQFGYYTGGPGSYSTPGSVIGGTSQTSRQRYMLLSISGNPPVGNCAIWGEFRLVYFDAQFTGGVGYNCTAVKTVISSSNTIESYAFDNAYGLRRIRCGLSYNRTNMFRYVYDMDVCYASNNVTFSGYPRNVLLPSATTPPGTIYGTVNTSRLQGIYVPDESVDAYKASSKWSAYSSYIKPISEYPDY